MHSPPGRLLEEIRYIEDIIATELEKKDTLNLADLKINIKVSASFLFMKSSELVSGVLIL